MKNLKKIKEIYEKNKDSENPPSYIKLIERLMELENSDEGV